jgi:hypothetical protein
VRRAEREAMLRQGVARAQTPRERRGLAGLEEDLTDGVGTGEPLSLRLRNFRPAADAYLAALGGPRAYMVRLRQIDEQVQTHREALGLAWRALADECADGAEFTRRWADVAAGWSFDEVNDLIERHNRWYPAESRLPMDPRRRDYALVNGRDYRRDRLDGRWVLQEFPPERDRVR